MARLTTVINIRDPQAQAGPNGNWYFGPEQGIIMPPDMVYIGRPGRGMTGYFGNPYVLGRFNTRERVLVMYESYFYSRLREDKEFASRIEDLHGKTLVCFCKPLACHGDVIARYLNGHILPREA